jgi:isopentenyldiphosphate isomerase
MVNNNELLCIVDKFDNPLEPMPRHEAFKKGHYRRTAHVWIRNSKNQILCQKRSMKKDQSPGMWEPAVAGHIGPDDNYFTGAIRELHEETGLKDITAEHLTLVKIYRDDNRLEYCAVFYCDWDVEEHHVTIEEDEVERVKLIYTPTLKRHLLYGNSNKWVKPQYAREMFSVLN